MNVNHTSVLASRFVKVSSSGAVLVFALSNALLYHYPLAVYGFDNIDYFSINGVRTLSTLFVIVFVVTTVLLFGITFFSANLLKGFCIITAFVNSIAIYFISTYQVILDKAMMGNIFNTQLSESLELLHPKMLLYIVFLGIVPAWVITTIKINKVKRIRTLAYAVTTLALGLVFIYINSSSALWFDQHSRKLGGAILPWSYIINSARLQFDRANEDVDIQLLPSPTYSSADKSVAVLVIGETARASNFSLYGYERTTNPLIAASSAVVLRNSTACSTYTTASIHCMLSHEGQQRGPYEPLPSYLQRHEVEVLWRTNNWGEPAVIVEEYIKSADLRKSCARSDCHYDGVMLTGLADRIKSAKKDKVLVVLHMKGSHGPSYHERYPEYFETFKPACKSVELDKCSSIELINAYDNTIVYTDYFLNQTIEELKRLPEQPTMMMYVSDHGESLGEYGLYLHGTPKALAPAVQLDIPYIVWMSENFKKLNNIDSTHFQRESYSHEHVFHSIMGALGLRSSFYKAHLDIFSTPQ